MAQPKYALSNVWCTPVMRAPTRARSLAGLVFDLRMTLIYPPLWRGRRIELERVLRWTRGLLCSPGFLTLLRPANDCRMAPLSDLLSPLSPQAGYITVNYDYELWAELERGGALGFLQDRLAHTFSRILSIFSINHGAKRKPCRRGCVF